MARLDLFASYIYIRVRDLVRKGVYRIVPQITLYHEEGVPSVSGDGVDVTACNVVRRGSSGGERNSARDSGGGPAGEGEREKVNMCTIAGVF